jgi:alkaline phosphatase D
MRRRTFLQLASASAAATALSAGRAGAGVAPVFVHGVASGDPRPDAVVLWTRVTPSVDAAPGSGLGADTAVAWEVARDDRFASVVAAGEVVARAAHDHTVKVDATGLPAATELWYRFRAVGQGSPVGRTRTAPAAGAAVGSLRLGVVSCSNYEGGYFSAYRHLAARDDLDLVLHLGDYLYEYGVGDYGPGPAIGREHDPAVEMTVLADYRRRHALYKTDPDLQALHARYAMVTTIDDHETTDNAWSDGAANHQPDEGEWAERVAQAFQAYFEWMPIRATGGDGDPFRIHRHLAFGDLAELFVLDERTHRSEQVAGVSGSLLVTSPEVADPDRTMLGAAQRDWLVGGLGGSTATWKLVGNPVMFAPLVLADLPDVEGVTPLLADALAALGASPPLVVNGDQWDGYQAEQALVRSAFAAAGGVVVLTGDIHSSWAAEVPADPGTYGPGTGASTAVEFVTPAVTSDSFSAALASAGVPGAEELSALLPTVVPVAGPWFKYVDPDRHGFGVLDVTAERVQFEWSYLSDRSDPEATVAAGPSFASPAGSNRLVPAGPLGPRPTAPPAPEGAGGQDPPSAAPNGSSMPPPPAARTLPATGGAGDRAAAVAAAVGAAALAGRAAARRAGQDPS